MIRSTEEIIESVRDRIDDLTTDENIAFLEDIQDTLTDLETRAAGDGVDWKARYEENDREWRQRYTDRFFNKEETDPLPDPEPEPVKEAPKTFEELFEEVEE